MYVCVRAYAAFAFARVMLYVVRVPRPVGSELLCSHRRKIDGDVCVCVCVCGAVAMGLEIALIRRVLA